ncbi:MAG: hypothetical protein ACYSWS_03425 [Planctomycetota bacterium]
MNKNKVLVFNPLNEDFTVKYDINNDRNPVAFTIKAKEVSEFNKIVADHLKKHLANRLFDLRGDYKKDRKAQMKKFYKQMKVK